MNLPTFTIDGLRDDLEFDSKEYWRQRCLRAEDRSRRLEDQLLQLQLQNSWRIDNA